MSNFTAEEITGCLVSELEFEGKIFIAHPDLVKINVNSGNSAVANHWAKHTELTEQQVQGILQQQALGVEVVISIPNYSTPSGVSFGCMRVKNICELWAFLPAHATPAYSTQMTVQKASPNPPNSTIYNY